MLDFWKQYKGLAYAATQLTSSFKQQENSNNQQHTKTSIKTQQHMIAGYSASKSTTSLHNSHGFPRQPKV